MVDQSFECTQIVELPLMAEQLNSEDLIEKYIRSMQRLIETERESPRRMETICYNIVFRWAYLESSFWIPCLDSLTDDVAVSLFQFAEDRLKNVGFRPRDFVYFAGTPSDDEVTAEFDKMHSSFERFYYAIVDRVKRA